MEKINIAELLRDCPNGMELDCTIYDNAKFIGVENYDKPICIRIGNGDLYLHLTKFGTWNFDKNAKCVIFPKGKTTWKGFHRPFKDGDIVTSDKSPFIYKNCDTYGLVSTYCAMDVKGNFWKASDCWTRLDKVTFATEEEKQKLFDAIKENGYKWNAETKTLEKLSKFKDGNILAIGDTVYIYNGLEELSPFPSHYVYAIADKNGLFAINTSTKKYGTRFATEEEKNILFEAIKNNGYKWYPDTKSLIKLLKPNFKVGDIIKNKTDK